MVKLKHFLIVFFVMVPAAKVWAQSDGESRLSSEELRSIVDKSIVHITAYAKSDQSKSKPIYGTGFVVSSDGFVLTAKHLFPEGASSYNIAGRIGSPHGPEIALLVDDTARENYDFALLRLGSRNQDYVPMTLAASDRVEGGTQLHAYGFPFGRDISSRVGPFDHKQEFGEWQVGIKLEYGMSGGPVLNEYGCVVAIVAGGVPAANAVSKVQEIERAQDILKRAKVSSLEPDCPMSAYLDRIARPDQGPGGQTTILFEEFLKGYRDGQRLHQRREASDKETGSTFYPSEIKTK